MTKRSSFSTDNRWCGWDEVNIMPDEKKGNYRIKSSKDSIDFRSELISRKLCSISSDRVTFVGGLAADGCHWVFIAAGGVLFDQFCLSFPAGSFLFITFNRKLSYVTISKSWDVMKPRTPEFKYTKHSQVLPTQPTRRETVIVMFFAFIMFPMNLPLVQLLAATQKWGKKNSKLFSSIFKLK